MTRMRASFRILACLAAVVLAGLGCPPPPPPQDNDQLTVPTPDLDINDAEPNDDAATAQSAALAGHDAIRIIGSIGVEYDIDVYELGSLSAGDRIAVYVNTTQAEVEPAVVIFDTDPDRTIGTLMAANETGPRQIGEFTLAIDTVSHHDGELTFLAVSALWGAAKSTGAYDLIVGIERGGTVLQPQSQTLLIDFDGGSTTTAAGEMLTAAAFDAADIDSSYVGQTEAVKDAILATIRENFMDYPVELLNTDDDAPPADRPFSTVFVGRITDAVLIAGAEGLGISPLGTDAYNQDPDDDAIVFVGSFGPEPFGIGRALTVEELGVAIGNVASHEAGHLLGLQHSFDPVGLMNTFDAPRTLLIDQRFKRSLIHFTVFDPMGNLLTQDADLLLAETVGRIDRTPDAAYTVGDTPFTVVTGDWDGDGDIDLAVANRLSDDLSILFNNGNAEFTEATNVPVGAGPIFLVTLDADGDDDLDFMTANPAVHTLTLLLNDGAGAFTPTSTYTAGTSPASLATGDFDRDGDTDVVAANFSSNDVTILFNDGDGDFLTAATHTVGENPAGVAADDLDGDGDTDLAVANFNTNDLSILINTGVGTFAEAVQINAGGLPGGLVAADLDLDGHADLAVANRLASVSTAQFIADVSVFINEGDGSFATPVGFYVGAAAESVTAADFDGDGDLDLAAASSGDVNVPQDTGSVSALLNNGDATFARNVVYRAGDNPAWITAADLDADGDSDLIVTNLGSGSVSVFLNHGDGTFGISSHASGQ